MATSSARSTPRPVDAADVDEDGDTSEVLPYDRAGAGRVIGLDVDLGAFEAP